MPDIITARRLAEIKARFEVARNAPVPTHTHAGAADPIEVTAFKRGAWLDIPDLAATLERAVEVLRAECATHGISIFADYTCPVCEFLKEFDHE